MCLVRDWRGKFVTWLNRSLHPSEQQSQALSIEGFCRVEILKLKSPHAEEVEVLKFATCRFYCTEI